MKILPPLSITDAILQSSTVPETDYAAWNSGTAYTIGQRVIVASTHRIYEALTNNTNKNPTTNPSDWLDLGATNRWRMFDGKVGTQTTATTSITVQLKPGIITGLTLLNLYASQVRVKMTDPVEGVVFDRTYHLEDHSAIVDYWEWFFLQPTMSSVLIVEGLPSYSQAVLEVTMTVATGATVAVGALLVGRIHTFSSAALSGVTVGIQSFSRKDRDEFGNWVIVRRGNSKRARWSVPLIKRDVDQLMKLLTSLDGVGAVYIGGGNYDSTTIYGFCRDFDIVISYPTYSECSIEIEGML